MRAEKRGEACGDREEGGGGSSAAKLSSRRLEVFQQTVRTSNQLEKPRFVILAFQTNRRSVNAANASRFDHCKITNVKLLLNSQCYPYGNMNLDVNRHQYAML